MSIAQKNERGGSLAALFVRRPVLAVVINAMIVVAGLAALLGVEVRELPSVERPVISISTSFPGAAAETIDREVTAVVEGAVARVQGVTGISSSSFNGQSRVTLEFSDGVNLDVATSDVRDALSRTTRSLPDGVETPTIFKADSDAQAVIQLAVTSDTMSVAELSALVDDVISERLGAVDGVAEVQVYGTRNTAFEVDVDPLKLASLGLTVADVRTALSTIAFDTPAGSINGPNQNITVRAISEVTTPADFEAIIIKDRTLLGDVATVVFDAAASTSSLRSDGKPGIGLGIVRQAQSNTIEISKGIHAAVETLNETLPEGVTIKVSSDDAVFIDGALHEVQIALIVSLVVVVGIIFLFLLDWRATIVPALAMPIALLGAVAGIYLAGFSLNIITLLALVLATGLVVDDAIVVLENIVRRKNMGAGPRAAAVLGTQEVFFAVVATTLTLAAVFIPLSFLSGQTGRLFREFGFTLAIAVLLSSVVALSMGPMLASRLLKTSNRSQHRGVFRAVGSKFATAYRVTLKLALANPFVVVLVALLFAGSSYFVYGQLRQEITPPEDRSQIQLRIQAPNTVSLDYIRTQLTRVEAMLQPFVDSGEVRSIFVLSGWGSGGWLTLTLAPWGERERSQQQIANDINVLMAQVPGVRASVGQGNSLGIRGGGSGLQFAVVGSDYTVLADTANQISELLQDDGRFGRVTVNFDTTQPQLTLTVDRTKADALGIDINGLATTMQAMIDGSDIGTVFINDSSYTVRMISTSNPVNDPRDLESLFVKTGDGRYVPMSTIATIVEAAVPPSLRREQQRRAVPVTASLDDGLALGDAYYQMLELARPILPEGTSIVPLAEAKTLGEASNGLFITFGFALVIILLVLAAQFESVWSAVIVMTTVPFGVAAALYALLATGGSLNIFSQIGLVLVVGIMAKNGILIVEFANQLRDKGLSVPEAIEQASNIRLRPVMMTMIATILGGLPLVLASGAGAEARSALGWVMVGGLSFAAISTLYLTPVAYLLLARFSKPKAAEEARLERELDAANAAPEPAE
ncbi:multidrug transporter AcrB [Devosia limi DSM 17137]|uniref:Hydrophobic/amphiphilic exporter-1, HAE1 family n=1 Tax=Devosia limi DSM 17137 TaxID=1121477 RepID=A0A0F5LPC0_9HYPH|nr:efflux RND transporter permease subunit [Devosia limi]KKB84153.1 multidrug transporter AcrB [Devosia limi DSM 17137]SHE93955.1 hydrophobic/amphiphilic exporter-1, HAE1 family [Devosia limi DSM 17137]